MAIIIPTGTVDAWQAAHRFAHVGAWTDVEKMLLRHAAYERDQSLRDDLITLVLVAGSRALDCAGG